MENIDFEETPTTELDMLLQSELRKDVPDGDLVRNIIHVLEERDQKESVDITPQLHKVWDKINHEDNRRAERLRPMARDWIPRVAVTTAAVILVTLALMLIPSEAHAETFWEKLARFTDSFFEFMNPSEAGEIHTDYVFRTDNPGLQEVYDAVVELGVTEPVVPMWLPEGYELGECRTVKSDSKKCVYAVFTNGELKFIYSVEVYEKNVWHEYQKDDADVTQYETGGVMHAIMQNIDSLVVVWGSEKIECFISAECDENQLYSVIDSIYNNGGL